MMISDGPFFYNVYFQTLILPHSICFNFVYLYAVSLSFKDIRLVYLVSPLPFRLFIKTL